MSLLRGGEEDRMAWGYLWNALGVITELTLRDTDLLGIQALLGIAIILQGTPNPQPASVLVAAAIRSSHNLGLHRSASLLGLDPVEVEQRRRVFWIAYLLDKDLSLRLDQPPVQSEVDLDVDLPIWEPGDGLGYIYTSNGTSKIHFFRLHIALAIIQERIYRMLYSVQALKQSHEERLVAVEALNGMLETWIGSLALGFQAENLAISLPNSSILHMVILHLSYFSCLTMVHGVPFQNNDWSINAFNYYSRTSEVVISSQALCVSAARSSIRLMDFVPHGDYACIWYA
jgi:hypothetical protein